MPKESVYTKIAVMERDIEYIKSDIQDVKRLQYWLLGLFGTLFVLLIATFIGLAIK